jgi:hypothetical protein
VKYTDAVSEARQLVKRSEADQWRLAELTWEQVESGRTIKDWAADIGVSKRTASAWKAVWTRWRMQELHVRPAWAEAYEQVNPTGAKPESVDRAIRNMPPEKKAAVVREALADPEITRQIMSDPDTRATVQRADRERVEERFERGRIEPSDTSDRLAAMGADLEWLTALDRAASALAEAQTLMARAPKAAAQRMAGVKTLDQINERVRVLAEVLGSDVDAEWEAMNR